jgi:predicted transcriptional regulator
MEVAGAITTVADSDFPVQEEVQVEEWEQEEVEEWVEEAEWDMVRLENVFAPLAER